MEKTWEAIEYAWRRMLVHDALRHAHECILPNWGGYALYLLGIGADPQWWY